MTMFKETRAQATRPRYHLAGLHSPRTPFRRRRTILLAMTALLLTTAARPALAGWPPRIGQILPDDTAFIDQDGRKLKLSHFKGKVIFLEYVGMNCPACQAFSGANRTGPYQGNPVQRGLQSIEEYFPRYTGGIRLSDPRIVFIQILLYDMRLEAPKPSDARNWAAHFGLKTQNQEYVLVPLRDLRSPASYNLIPGFQLIDRDFRVRSDSTGHHPQDDLYRTLLPMVRSLIE